MKLLKNEWLQLLILGAPFCAAALLWDRLPAHIPIHWNAHGQIDGYAGRTFGAFFLPCLNVGLAILLSLLPRADSRIKQSDAEIRENSLRTIKNLRVIITLFISSMALAILAFALNYHFDMTRFAVTAASLMFVLMGNFMGKLRPNRYAGIRTSWTLGSRTVWARTHRLAGRVMVAGGLFLFVLVLLIPPGLPLLLCFVPVTLVIVLVPTVCSYLYYREEKDAHPAA